MSSNGFIKVVGTDDGCDDLEFDQASFENVSPKFAHPVEKFAAVFTDGVSNNTSRSFDLNVAQLIQDIAFSNKPVQAIAIPQGNPPQACSACGGNRSHPSPVEQAASHPDVLNMLRNVLDRLSTIDTRLERVEKLVNADFFSKALVPSSFDALWFDMRNQLEDPAYLSRLEVEDRKIQGRWRAGTAAALKGIYNRRRNVATAAGDDSSSSSSSASDAYGAGGNDTETGDINVGVPAADAATASAVDQSMGTTVIEGADHADVADDVEIPTDTWMDDGGGLEAFVADVVSSQMDIASGHGSSESNSDNSGMPS